MLEHRKTNINRKRMYDCRYDYSVSILPTLTPSSFDNLIMRFEEPSSMARWDSPLFAISWDDDIEGASRSILDDLWLAVTQGAKKGPTAAVVTVSIEVEQTGHHLTVYIHRASSLLRMRCKL